MLLKRVTKIVKIVIWLLNNLTNIFMSGNFKE